MVNPGTWLTAYYFSLILRDRDATSRLCQVPSETLRNEGFTAPEYFYLMIDAIQTTWRPDENGADQVLAAIRSANEITDCDYTINISAPLLIFGVLIFDMIHTTVSRILRGDVRTVRQWLEYTGRDHLHHRFESLLRSKVRAVLLVLVLAATLGLSALTIRRVGLDGSMMLLVQCGAILLIVTILEHAGNKQERRRP